MEGSFVRSPNVPKGVRGRISNIRIDDIPNDRWEEAIQHMKDYYMKEVPMSSTLMKIAPFSDEDLHEFYHNALNDNISIYAVDEANNEEIELDIMGSFVRSPSVPKGVRGKFSTFRIEDIPDNKRDQAIQHMKDYFFKDEPTTQVLKKTAPFSDEDIHAFLTNALNDNVSLYAIDEANNEEIAGVTILRVSSRCDPHRHEKVDSKLKSMQRLFNFLHYCHEGVDPFTIKSGSKEVVVDHVLEPMGLSVSPQYRGRGIGQALIQARHKLAAELGVGATMGIYTSIYSQAIILKQGMDLVKEVPYSEYTEDGKVLFAELNPPHPSAKVIGGLLKKD